MVVLEDYRSLVPLQGSPASPYRLMFVLYKLEDVVEFLV